MQSRSKRIIAFALAIALMIGCSFAYFSDYVSEQATGKAGTVAVSFDSGINLLDANGRDIINPGDQRDADFTVTNEGNKSIDVRTTIVMTAVDHAGNDINFTGDAATQSEYDLYLRDDVSLVEGKGYMPNEGAEPIAVKSINGNQITYVLPEYVLNGNSDKYNEVETADEADGFAKEHDFVFVMKGAAGNAWQGSAVQIDVIVEAKQHENTAAGWDIVAQETVTSGNISKDVVLGENVITDGVNAPATPDDKKTYIPVISKNENGEDLNATSTLIEGELADKLLDALDESGLANKEDIDLLIDVESDDFDGMADTTFDVSEVAKEGDTVIILHYNEEKQEWEYISTDTVEDGKVGGDFSSYSPVGFIVIPKDDDEVEGNLPEEPSDTGVTFNVVDENGDPIEQKWSVTLMNAEGNYLSGMQKGGEFPLTEPGTYKYSLWIERFDDISGYQIQKDGTFELTEDTKSIDVEINIEEFVVTVQDTNGNPCDVHETFQVADANWNSLHFRQLNPSDLSKFTSYVADFEYGTYDKLMFDAPNMTSKLQTTEVTIDDNNKAITVTVEPWNAIDVTFNITNNSSLATDEFSVKVYNTIFTVSDGETLRMVKPVEGYLSSANQYEFFVTPEVFSTSVEGDSMTVDLVISDRFGTTVSVTSDTEYSDFQMVGIASERGSELGLGDMATGFIQNGSFYANIPEGTYVVNLYNDGLTGILVIDGSGTASVHVS